MELRPIGSLRVSVVGLGCNNFGMTIDEQASTRVVDAALDAGINFFDTADIYGSTRSESFLGRALGRRRQQAVVATKFGLAVDDQRKGARPDYVRRAAEDSLKRLGTDYIDLYQLHQPDPDVPIADTLAALNDLVQAGKVKEIGCSNFSTEQLDEAARATRHGAARFVSVQNEYSTPFELAISWLAAHPPVASVIAGATSPQQVRANAAAANWLLTSEERAEIDRIALPQ
jgi:aryl-alcohol dehydrogenase-like predicted oxidoreductase